MAVTDFDQIHYDRPFFPPEKNKIWTSATVQPVNLKDKNSPDFTCEAFEQMREDWVIMRDIVSGTRHIRRKGRAYLPEEPGENPKHYKYRLKRAVFFNFTDRTLNGLVGMVFRNEPKLSENVPEIIRGREAANGQVAVEGEWENIDNAGTKGSVFCKEVFIDAVRDGHAAILVDMPPPLPEGSTQADEMASGRRVYWQNYRADQIINWRTEVINGKTRLSLVVLKEQADEASGEYGQEKITRYRVLRPGAWELYREVVENGKRDIVLEASGNTSLSEIPLAVIYSRKVGWIESQPPLIDIAEANIAHYQKYNDLSIYLHLCRPILCRKNAEKKPVQNISPYAVMDVGTDGNIWYAEPTGAGLEPSAKDIENIEQRISVLGLSLLVKQTSGPVTATEERNDQIEESSDLSTWVSNLRDAIELALKFHAQYLDPAAETGGNIELGAMLDDLALTPQEMTVWSNAVAAGQYSVETMWRVFDAGGKLPPDFDAQVERQRLDEEQQRKADLAELALRKFESGQGGG